MDQILKQIAGIGIVPVIALNDAKDAKPLAQALCDGGLACAEVTFRTAAAEDAIREMTEGFPDMLVGAGTVLTTEQVDRAVNAGAKFIVSPGLNPEVVKYCVDKNIPVVPGCATPSEVEQAIGLGLETVKFFPAEAAGGIAMIKAMAAPYTNIKFMPTGGITAKNLKEYLDFEKVIACGGSWMVKPELIANGDFRQITALTREAVDGMLGFEMRHLGINASDAEDAGAMAEAFCGLFHFPKKTGPISFFAGIGLELMNTPGPGTNGHIAIATNDILRAIYHLEKQGVAFRRESAKYHDNGKMYLIYLEKEIGGFAVHLLQK